MTYFMEQDLTEQNRSQPARGLDSFPDSFLGWEGGEPLLGWLTALATLVIMMNFYLRRKDDFHSAVDGDGEKFDWVASLWDSPIKRILLIVVFLFSSIVTTVYALKIDVFTYKRVSQIAVRESGSLEIYQLPKGADCPAIILWDDLGRICSEYGAHDAPKATDTPIKYGLFDFDYAEMAPRDAYSEVEFSKIASAFFWQQVRDLFYFPMQLLSVPLTFAFSFGLFLISVNLVSRIVARIGLWIKTGG